MQSQAAKSQLREIERAKRRQRIAQKRVRAVRALVDPPTRGLRYAR